MGYSAAFSKQNKPPLAIILTAERIEVLVFPFTAEKEGEVGPQCLLIAAIISMNLWMGGGVPCPTIDRNVLMDVLVLCKVGSQLSVQLTDVEKYEFMTNLLTKLFILDPYKEAVTDLRARMEEAEKEAEKAVEKAKREVEKAKREAKREVEKAKREAEADKEKLRMEIAQLQQRMNL